VPASGAGTSMVALSDSSVIRLCSASTLSPSDTRTSITSTSSKSPMSGTVTVFVAMAASCVWFALCPGPPAGRGSDRCRNWLLRVQAVFPDGLGNGFRLDLAVIGQRFQGRHGDVVAVYLEEASQLLAGVGTGLFALLPRLADKLNVEIGNRIVLTFQDLNNEITSGSFTITGLFRTASNPYDERNVFVRADDLQELLAGQPVYHEVAMMLRDEELSNDVAAGLNTGFENIAAETWYELSPELRYITDMGGSLIVYIMAVILLALAFGILNTMLMAIFERMRELGMLLAIGMSKLRVFLMIMMESVILTLTGASAGLILAYFTLGYLGEKGIDMTAMGGDAMAEFGYDAVVYPIAYTDDYITTIILVVITAILAAVYPAIKALRLNPGEVVRE
jgi:ABC-type lipoprotein release transport system permease subunit